MGRSANKPIPTGIYKFRNYIFKWFSIFGIAISSSIGIMGLIIGENYTAFAFVLDGLVIGCYLLYHFKKEQIAVYILFLSITLITVVRALYIQNGLNFVFAPVFMVIAGILSDTILITILFAINVGVLIYGLTVGLFVFSAITDEGSGLYYANEALTPLAITVMCYIISIIIYQVLLKTIRKQDEQNIVLKQTQARLITQEKMASIRVLTAGIAHDFNNILTSILGNLELVSDGVVTENEKKTFIKEAKDATLRARYLTQQLLTFSKETHTSEMKTFDLLPLIQETVGFSSSGSQCRTVIESNEGLWPIMADENQIGLVIQNLLINAIQAMPNGGTIHIKLDNTFLTEGHYTQLPAGKYCQIFIIDEGVGISQANINKIFDPYYTTKDSGTGLGLAVSHTIIDNHKGYIDVDSEVGLGTTFTILLPAGKGPVDLRKEDKTVIFKTKGHILVMDDEESVQSTLVSMLSRFGLTVDISANGQEALMKYQSRLKSGSPYDVVFSDLTIKGGMGGKELMTHLKKLDPDVSVIISSGYLGRGMENNFEDVGFKGQLKKPYTFSELAQILDILGFKSQNQE